MRHDLRTEAQNDLLLKALDGIGDTIRAQNTIIQDALADRTHSRAARQ